MLNLKSTLSIRSESSHELSDSARTDRSACFSMDSALFEAGDVS